MPRPEGPCRVSACSLATPEACWHRLLPSFGSPPGSHRLLLPPGDSEPAHSRLGESESESFSRFTLAGRTSAPRTSLTSIRRNCLGGGDFCFSVSNYKQPKSRHLAVLLITIIPVPGTEKAFNKHFFNELIVPNVLSLPFPLSSSCPPPSLFTLKGYYTFP